MAERRRQQQAHADRVGAQRTADDGSSAGRRGRVRPPSARSLEREQEIYDVAADIFHRKGYSATTLQDIADGVGLLKGSLYYYIDSKEDLLYRISQTIHQSALANLDASRAVGGPASARLRALVEGHVLAFGERMAWIRAFYTEHAALSGDRRREIMAKRRSYERYVEDLVREGQSDGSFCPQLDGRIAVNGVLTMVNSVYLWYQPGRDLPIERVAGQFGDVVLGGLRCSPAHAHAQAAASSASHLGDGGAGDDRDGSGHGARSEEGGGS